MALTRYPFTPTDPNQVDTTDDQDPTTLLHNLLTGGVPPTPRMRNQAMSAGIAHKYGVDNLADGSVSQSDLEDLDNFMQQGDIARSTAAPKVQGQYALAGDTLKNKGAMDVENARAASALALENAKAASAEKISHIAHDNPFGEGGGGGSNEVDQWAQAAANSPNGYAVLSSIKDKNLLNAVQARLAETGRMPQKLSNQTQQMGEAASALLDQMPGVLTLGEKLNQAGLFHPVVGTVRQFLANHGAASVAGVDPQTASDIGDFNTQMGLLQSGVARAHAGARGAGNSEIAKRFEQLMNANGDYPTFLGSMRGMTSFLSRYQSALHNGANPDNPNDPLLKQLEMQLQQEGGGQQGGGMDLGASWGGR